MKEVWVHLCKVLDKLRPAPYPQTVKYLTDRKEPGMDDNDKIQNTTVDDLPTGLVHEGMLSMEVLSRDSNEFLIACVTGPDYGWIQLPVFNYPYYHAADLENPKMEFEIHDGGNRTVGVLLPANYEGILHVYWQEPVFWRVSEVVSYITFALCILYLLAISDKDNGIKRIYNRLSKNGTDKEHQE